jgi:hypothetical protein
MKHELNTEITIDAPAETVWEILTDLGRYPEWNPFVTSSLGTPKVGETLVNRLEPPDGRAMTFKPKVTVVEEGRVFEWIGRLGLPGLFDGRHRFEVHQTHGGSVFKQQEYVSGILVRLLRKTLDDNTVRGFEAMNLALKERAESR